MKVNKKRFDTLLGKLIKAAPKKRADISPKKKRSSKKSNQ